MNHGQSDLQTALATLDLMKHEEIEWHRVQKIRFLLHQHLRYEYPGPIYDLHQHLMILPPDQHGDQHRLDYRLDTSASVFEMTHEGDDFDNEKIRLDIPHVAQAVDFEAIVLVERTATGLSHYAPLIHLTNKKLLEPSALTGRNNDIEQAARNLQEESADPEELAHNINTWTYQHLSYKHDVTTIHTTATEALTGGYGVCQDYAHVMLALCHVCGLPARYVSGHLLGEGGTHAWVEVLLPDSTRPDAAHVVPFDPTHGRKAGLNYLTIAVGRDYYDVAPTSGTFRASYTGQLITKKRVGLTTIEYQAAES